MGCLGVHFAITQEQMKQLDELFAADEDEAIVEAVEKIEEEWDREQLYETDKAWDAIHRCLCDDHTPDGTLDPEAGEYPLKLVIYGGDCLYSEEDQTICLVRPVDVLAVAKALAGVTEAWMRERYFALDSEDVEYSICEETFGYTWRKFQGLPAFFAKAAKAKRAVLFTVDH